MRESNISFFPVNFLLGYVCCTGGFSVTIPNRLTLYIGWITPQSLPLDLLPAPLAAIARGFFVLFHVGI
jgi:hypothetical protein